ncbi:uncharacterized protein LOC9635700 [Selaginella moellendorffii]|uniref:uncharacterized protein LOC9635700 n=1 Tax=Selaginella moellendorffii TaxID=88036 RepID=UPI000D1C6841|nr:uncharacterized protein LOC9635700 [Selaginella moellendorffii]|eukprot:XP_024526488.1 uncharacterized protein LOC9635700 [Selaginella moellendorffii]
MASSSVAMEIDDSPFQGLERSIKAVEAEIEGVEKQLASEQDPVERQYLWKKKHQLREEKQQLREEKLLLLKSNLPHGTGGSDATRYNYELPTSLEAGDMFHFCPEVFHKDFYYVQQVWKPFYTEMSKVTQGHVSVVHVSGNPGIGKSHFLVYVLVNLLKEGKTVQVELVIQETVDYYAFYPDGTYQILNEFNRSLQGEILLTDQSFVGHYGRITYIFASPNRDNWVDAWKNITSSCFQQLFMPPWSFEELENLFYRYAYLEENRFSDPRTEFRVRNLLFGPIPRWYFFTLENGYQEILKNVQGMVGEGVLQVQDLRGAGDKEEYSYTVFTIWPSVDFLSIQSIRPISQWVSQSIVEVAAYRKLKGFETFVLAAESDPALKVAAGNLFKLEEGHKFQNFPIVDSITPNHMIQVSLAKSRKPMDQAVFSRLRSDLNQKMLSDEDKQLVLAGDLRYRQIQALCKKYGIHANQHKEVMLEELKELVALANVQDGGSLQEEQLRLIVKTIALQSGFSVNSGWHYLTLKELFTSVKNDIHYGDYEPFFALEDDAVEDNGYAAMDNWDIKLGFHGGGIASGFESEIVYTALMEETQVTLKLAHLDGTLVGKQTLFISHTVFKALTGLEVMNGKSVDEAADFPKRPVHKLKKWTTRMGMSNNSASRSITLSSLLYNMAG